MYSNGVLSIMRYAMALLLALPMSLMSASADMPGTSVSLTNVYAWTTPDPPAIVNGPPYAVQIGEMVQTLWTMTGVGPGSLYGYWRLNGRYQYAISVDNVLGAPPGEIWVVHVPLSTTGLEDDDVVTIVVGKHIGPGCDLEGSVNVTVRAANDG